MGRLLPALLVSLSGCASIPPDIGKLDADTGPLELVDTPFYPQEQYQCGPAALATALASSGVSVEPGELVERVYVPGRLGSLQVELLAATRTAGRVPYVIDGALQALWHELEAGRPVVVLQNLGVAAIPRWHYAVVVGIDTERGDIVLRSGIDKRRITRTTTFLRTWRRGDYWGFVTLRPDELPAKVDRARYLRAVADLEAAGEVAAAVTAWKTALQAWPSNRIALFGLGNTEMKAGSYAAAETRFRAILEQDVASVIARNNLAIALARQARYDEAMSELAVAIEDNTDSALQGELLDTKALIQDMARRPADP